MDGYEQIEVGSVTIAAQHDEDNDVMLMLSSPRTNLAAYLNPSQTDALIAMLQRMQARQRGQG